MIFWVARDAGLYPLVFADERTYSLYSRLAPLSQSNVPSYLYLKVFGLTNACGEGFYTCARLGNLLFLAGGLFLVFRVALRVCRPSLALLVGAVAAVDPLASLGTYFMPEAMYFFGFWLLAWLLVRGKSLAGLGAASGTTLGALALVKAHALFLVPPAALLLLAVALTDASPARLRRLVVAALAMASTFGLLRFGLGYLLAGDAALSLVGTTYGSVATMATDPGAHKASVASLAVFSLWGQSMALLAIFGLPVLVALHLWPRSAKGPLDSRERLQLFTAAALLTLLAVVAVFTASVAGDGTETAGRLHLRYYCFLFPALAIVAAAEVERSAMPASTSRQLLRWITAAVIGSVGLYGAVNGLKGYSLGFADCPEAYGLSRLPGMLLASGIGVAVLCLAWVRWPRVASLVAVLWLVPVLVVSNTRVNKLLNASLKPTPWDAAGHAARMYLGDRLSQLSVLTEYTPGLYRTAFALDVADVALITIKPAEPIDPEKLPKGRDWVLLVGVEGHPLPEGATVAVAQNGFTLFQVHPPQATSP
ncbi:MAG: hypothetical protein QM723_36715 [Myxococcaceae bacterium]